MPSAALTTAYLDLVEGRRKGLLARLGRAVLATLSIPYGLGVVLRNLAFRVGCLRIHRLPVPVVSVGNLTLGGTGKTPMVALFARRLLDRGHRVAVLSRGYGKTAGGDDEALCPEGVVRVVDACRVRGGRRALDEHGATCLLLDDGFQHRALGRDLDVVLVDASRPLAAAGLFPRGALREPVSALARAHVVVLTRVDQASPVGLETARAAVLAATGRAPAEAIHAPVGVRHWPASALGPLDRIAGTRVFGFCGIGNPEAFRRALESCGARVAGFLAFPDHHPFTQADRDRVSREADAAGADWLVCTAKDALRLADDWRFASRPIRILEVRMEFVRGEQAVWQALDERCAPPVAAGRTNR